MPLKKIKGFVKNLTVSDAMMDDGSKERKEGLITALASSAMGQPSPGSIILAGHQGFKGKYIEFEIENIKLRTIFTDIHFNENDIVIAIYDEDFKENINCLGVLNPSNGILSMAFKLDSGTIANIKSIFYFKIFMDVGTFLIMCIIIYFSTDKSDPFYYYYLFMFLGTIIITSLLSVWNYYDDKKFNLLTEDILNLFGFKDVERINLTSCQQRNQINVMQSYDFRYREVVDYDPYPHECIPELLKEIENDKKN